MYVDTVSSSGPGVANLQVFNLKKKINKASSSPPSRGAANMGQQQQTNLSFMEKQLFISFMWCIPRFKSIVLLLDLIILNMHSNRANRTRVLLSSSIFELCGSSLTCCS